ncbi:SMC5-SMC6 complex localization factor protein 1 isoform X3 [Corythoichthys intestinalis]|uniref:SMC5-SMC6 complex localization factor protein 1 isoform X3 n=1 Tax=Corythoichthys intestinalis TaxID=161448 RepID=UPI0025A52FEA|nr:SMC5-SMC6 complex localization factor protein 1 isoform X3 [Corythoichthys intestinalis]
MESCRPVFQISGIKNNGKKRDLLKGIQHLNGKYIGGSIYQSICTHLIIPQVLASEKFLASCAAGKWIVTPNYVLDSVENGSWLPEGPYEVSIPTRWMHCYTVRDWREKVISGTITGAFQGWRVLLMVQDAVSSIMFKRVLEAGAATVYSNPTHASITHVLAKPVTQGASSHNAPCYPVSHIVQYLFQRKSVNMDLNITNDDNEGKESADIDLSKLEVDLRDCAIKQQDRPRFIFTESMGYHSPHRSLSEGAEMAKFCNVGAMIECGLYMEALDTIQNAAFPGIVPPSSYMVSLIKYAQKGSATTVFLRRFRETMHRLLINTAPWHKKLFYSQVLQCPHCKKGQWPFLETAISYCLSSNDTCHQFPGPALPTLIQFHHDILAFFLNLFQRELNSITMGNLFQCPETEVCKVKTSGFLLYGTFWTVWERATLLSGAVKRLIELIMQAGHLAGSDEHKWHLLAILLDLLSVLVEFWCTQHFKLNPKLVEKGLEDLAEHFAITSQTVSSAVIVEMIARISTNRLKLPLVDAIFRNMCCKHGITVGDGPLSLKKVVLSYLPALGHLAQNHSWTQHTTNSCSSLDTNCETVSPVENELGRECIPGGLNKVNAAGSSLLRQTDDKSSAALDLISDASQKAELLRSAQLGDSNLNCTGVLNYDLLEAASGMLANLLVCYQEESGLSDCIRSNDASHTLARALETHPLQMVTLDWTDQQAVSLAGDIETLLELARGKHSEQVCDAVKAYKGDSTVVFMQLLDDLECQGKILMPEVNP